TKIVLISDGTSNTILYSEAAARDAQYYTGNVYGGPNTSITGAIWAGSDNPITVTGPSAGGQANFGQGPCVVNWHNPQGDIYSFHTGGANIAFADGSVRFVRETITIQTLAALVTRASDEIIDSNSF